MFTINFINHLHKLIVRNKLPTYEKKNNCLKRKTLPSLVILYVQKETTYCILLYRGSV